MVSLSLTLTGNTSQGSFDHHSLKHKASSASAVSVASTASSSIGSCVSANDDDENATIKVTLVSLDNKGKGHSTEDLRLLAVSTRITELSYSISDIQTRIFEIQELRHQSQTAGDTQNKSTNVIDQALMTLDERLEEVGRGMKAVSEAVEPFMLDTQETPTQSNLNDDNGHSLLVRKHAALIGEWEAVQDESDVLREELKEDKWLTVFRTVSEQADGMMSSLEKAVKRCQDFIWQVHRRGPSEDNGPNFTSGKSSVNYETFSTLLESFEAKKKHYMPATNKVLSIIDRGVQDRVTKNGECLRRHAESTQRWKDLREKMQRTDVEMENVRKMLLGRELALSETSSIVSEKTSKSSSAKHGNGLLATPPSSEPSRSRAPSTTAHKLTRSISPFRKLAKKISRSAKAETPPPPIRSTKSAPSTDSRPTLNHRKSFFPFRNINTPDRPAHKYSQSLTPESSTSVQQATEPAPAFKVKPPRWNSSTKVEDGSITLKQHPPKRPSLANLYTASSDAIPPVPPLPRSQSRTSISRPSISSRPMSPNTSSVYAVNTSTGNKSRAPSRVQNRSHSPGPAKSLKAQLSSPSSHTLAHSAGLGSPSSYSDVSSEDDRVFPTSLMQRAMSPTMSISAKSSISNSPYRARTPGGSVHIPAPRPPSRSMIPAPIPSFHVSRPSSAMSSYDYGSYDRSNTSMSFRSAARGAQTPEPALRARASQVPFFVDPISPSSTRRPGLANKLPPSSYRETSATPSFSRVTGSLSRPESRAGASTPLQDSAPVPTYIPVDPNDPLDVAVAAAVNGYAHGLHVERVDPPQSQSQEGDEVRAQYAFSNQQSRKVVTCRLATTTRIGTRGQSPVTTQKVMCRVGGGWQELQLYMLNRQAGVEGNK